MIPATFPEQLFTEEEREILEQLPVFGSDEPRLLKLIEWLQDIRLNMDKSPSDAKMQQLAELLHLQMVELFQGNAELMDKYWNLIKPKENEAPLVYGLDQELAGYIDRMFDYYYRQRE
ncbi:hypothetical protein CLV36_10464 [Laceyella sediminis]|uniref:TipAS antibiotic-recognition protein n=1 Tax=Laceyella sediminis TaxID=573074 RepID=A0ABX5EPZ1_9BACL|nr:hypothetical protein CLV36_10464 [Laceyella sediminis]